MEWVGERPLKTCMCEGCKLYLKCSCTCLHVLFDCLILNFT